jgi:hypothetical protein
VIHFSDADENTPTSVAAYQTVLDGIRAPISTPNGGTVRAYSVSSMIVEDLAKPACAALGPFSELGTKFMQISGLTGGIVASICDADFSAGLLSVGNYILEQTTAVRLAYVPNIDTIQIFQNGAGVSNNATNGWTFESATNRIIFHGTAIPQGSQVLLTINYKPADIVR